jgi:hypothetical protein
MPVMTILAKLARISEMTEQFVFEPQRFGPELAGLLNVQRFPELGPGTPEPKFYDRLRHWDLQKDLAEAVGNPAAARACLAGLWLYFDYLEESHAISQELPTAEGAFWHAIMHRREPDAWNSKYWWRRVGEHPVIEQLREQASRLGYSYTSPEAFVDFCERARGRCSPEEHLARQVQLLEWQLLFQHCYNLATQHGNASGLRR